MGLGFEHLSDFDFCGSIAGLINNSRHRHKSCFGGFLVLLVGIAALIITSVYLKTFFNRETPKMSSNSLKFYTPPRINISSNFTVAIMIQIANINSFLNELVRVEAEYKTKNKSSSRKCPINIVKCNRSDSLRKKNYMTRLNEAKRCVSTYMVSH